MIRRAGLAVASTALFVLTTAGVASAAAYPPPPVTPPSASPSLSETGATSVPLLVGAGGLIALGGVGVYAARRRRNAEV